MSHRWTVQTEGDLAVRNDSSCQETYTNAAKNIAGGRWAAKLSQYLLNRILFVPQVGLGELFSKPLVAL